MATTGNVDKMGRTALEMAEAQRDAYDALTENFTAAQRRSMELAEGGLEFVKLQEDNAKAAQEWFAGGVKLLRLQQRNAEFAQNWTGDAVEALREQTEHNARTAEVFARGISKQQEGARALTRQWVGAYRDFFSPFAYAQQGLKTAEKATRRGLEATEQVTRQGLRVAEEATEQTEKVLRETAEATHEAEVQAAVRGALKTEDYEALNVDEVSKRLEGLSNADLKKVREYEKRNKDRETLIEQIDRKIRANA